MAQSAKATLSCVNTKHTPSEKQGISLLVGSQKLVFNAVTALRVFNTLASSLCYGVMVFLEKHQAPLMHGIYVCCIPLALKGSSCLVSW